MQRLFLGFAWLLISAGVIITAVAGLQAFFYQPKIAMIEPPVDTIAINAPQPQFAKPEVKGVETVVEDGDARALLVTRFLERHDSPLQPYDYFGQVFVNLADKNGFDFRLLPAIAMQESNLCKRIPENSYNCLGFGIHERGTLRFESFEANFERAARELKANYINQGLTTPEQIMTKYTPSSNGSWAASVNQWMAEMRYDDRTLGRELKTNGSVLEFAQPASPSPIPPGITPGASSDT